MLDLVTRLNEAFDIEILRKYFRYARKRGRFREYSGRHGFARWRESHPFLARHIVRTYGDPSGRIVVSPDERKVTFSRMQKKDLHVEAPNGLSSLSQLECKKIARQLASEVFNEHIYF